MRRAVAFTLGAWLAGSLAAAAAPQDTVSDQANRIDNGRYQAVIADCSGCHTKPGGAYLAGGDPIQTPFGTLVPPNITMDAETGIGGWSLQDFRNAMTKGVGHDGKHLYPAMPYVYYSKMPVRDIDDIYSYLKTVTPVHNKVVANQLPFPFNIRTVMIGWNMMNFAPAPFKPDASQSAEWNRGAYLVQGPGHCAACHSAKNLLGGDKSSAYLKGADLQGWYAPNITGNTRIGVGGWSDADIVAYLKTGTNGRSVASGPMAEAVEASTSKMSEADLKAIAVYLKSLPDQDSAPQPLAASTAPMTAGQAIYRDNCSACHGSGGEGAKNLFPALKGNPIVMQDNATTLARVVLAGDKGAQTAGAVTRPGMPALGWRLTDGQVADVLSYIRNSWGNAAPAVTSDAVGKVRKTVN